MYEKDPKKRDESAAPGPELDVGSSPPTPPPPPSGGGPYAPPTGPPPAPPAPPDVVARAAEKKVLAGVLALILGGLGIHKFYLGYTNEGLIMLLVTVVGGGFGSFITCGLLVPLIMVMPIFGLIEGIIYLTKSDQEFAATYITGRRAWF